jgi:transmembrane sensor
MTNNLWNIQTRIATGDESTLTDIKVLDIAFNVKCYHNDKTVETTLLRGLIEVIKQGNKKQKPIYLHPNEKLIIEKFAANSDSKLPNSMQPANPKKITLSRLLTPILKKKKELNRMGI